MILGLHYTAPDVPPLPKRCRGSSGRQAQRLRRELLASRTLSARQPDAAGFWVRWTWLLAERAAWALGVVALLTWAALSIDGVTGARKELDQLRGPSGGPRSRPPHRT